MSLNQRVGERADQREHDVRTADASEATLASPAAEVIVRAPIEPAQKHGCYSVASLLADSDEYAHELRAAILVEAPWLLPIDGPVLDAYCLALSRVRRAEVWLAQRGDYDVSKKTVAHRRLVGDMRAWIETARRLAGVLGLHPEARMNLKVGASKSRAFDAGAAVMSDEDVAAFDARLVARISEQSAPTGEVTP